MKNIKIILALFIAAAMFSSCIKEVFPEDGTATKDQADQTLEERVLGLHAWMSKFDVIEREFHWDFGYGALMMQRELMGQDMVQYPTYANWRFWTNVLNLGPEYVFTTYPWRWYYRLIFLTNDIIASVPDYETATDDDRWFAGIAYYYRAFAYFDLVRLYQQGNYVDHPDGASVTIVTEKTSKAEAADNPRAKASDVYTMILEDLDKAYECLADYERSSLTMPDATVVEGMYARVYLEMGNYTEAKNHAVAAQEYYYPLNKDEWTSRTTGFNSPNNSSWMWCFSNTNNDEVVQTGIICWAGNMTVESDWSYSGPSGRNYIMIDAHLYSLISDSDFRKIPWKDPRGVIPFESDYWYFNYYAPRNYVSLKFRPGMGEHENYIIGNAVSVPLMRMEEMMLIEAEAVGRDNLAAGVTLLNDFVQDFRDPDYECTAATLEDFIEAVWIQRRIELWGEGFSLFDIKRLNKPVIRSYEGTNHNVGARYNTTAQPDWMNLVIPRTEINANDGISEDDNNPTPIKPSDAPPHVW